MPAKETNIFKLAFEISQQLAYLWLRSHNFGNGDLSLGLLLDVICSLLKNSRYKEWRNNNNNNNNNTRIAIASYLKKNTLRRFTA